MRPHSNNFHGFLCFINRIYQTMLSVNSPGIRTGQIAGEFFVGWWILKRVRFQNFNERLSLVGQMRRFQIWDVLHSGSGKDNLVHYHATSSAGMQSLIGV